MSLELPPRGTKGAELPKPLRPIIKAMSGTGELFRRSGMKVQGRPLARLNTVGARSGKSRSVVLATFPDGQREDSWLVVGSNAGSARHPGWAHNLAANPNQATLDVGKETYTVTAELLAASEWETAWGTVTRLSPGYKAYETKTDRTIPIFRLSVLSG